jgi:hypothetical protein
MVMQLGPAVLHAHQQQQSREDARNCQFSLWYWAISVMNAVVAGGCFKGVTLHLLVAKTSCCKQ